jgi:hypothetical protein
MLDTSLCFMTCLLIGKLLCFGQSLVLPLKQSFTLSQLLALNRNTGIASAATLASHFIPRRLFGVTTLRLYAWYKATLIKSNSSFVTLISIRCGSARSWKLEESLSNGNPLLKCLLMASQSCFLDRNTRTSCASLA